MNLGTQAKDERRRTILSGLFLAFVTLALYWPATTHGFMLLDDDLYVSDNPHVTSGLSVANVAWALTSNYQSNWHPLTWISHMLDCSLYGLFAGGHHLTNILLHSLNTLLVFVFWKRVTKSFWPSFVVAALFGWHPLHVESVAWIAERKDVLSTFFFMLTLVAYAQYAVEFNVQGSKFKAWYALALLFFALGLMSKPMLVTLPFVLLLLDFWPLGRIGCAKIGSSNPAARLPFSKLLVEKIPFFALTLAACIVTLIAQHNAMRPVAEVPFGARVVNALNAYAKYVGRTVWPLNLSIYYLLPAKTAVGLAAGAALVMAGLTAIALRWRSTFPWLLVGLLWFMGTFVPVIGLVQVGSQEMADRYAYIPLIGLLVAMVWSIDAALANKNRALCSALAAIVLAGCLALTHRQLGFWRDNMTLFSHALDVAPDNYFAEYELAMAYGDAGDAADAITRYSECLRINPFYEPAQYHLGVEFASVGKPVEAAAQFSDALKRDPGSQELHNDLGVVLAEQGKTNDAIAHFKQAIAIDPNNASPYVNYGNVLQLLGQTAAALANFNKARELAPNSPEVLQRLALLLATSSDPKLRDVPSAEKLAENAVELTQRQNPACLATLATAYAAANNFTNAITVGQGALDMARAQQLPGLAKQIEGNLDSYRRGEVPGMQK